MNETANRNAPAEPPEGTDEFLDQGTELGHVQVHNNVIATIARIAAEKVPGVVEMSGGLVEGLAGMISKKGSDRGIRVDAEEAGLSIELRVVLEYGARIPHVAWQIQNGVRDSVERMTGKPVRRVEVVVEGVKVVEPRLPAPQEGTAP